MTAEAIAVGPILGTAPSIVPRSLRQAFSTSLLWSERVSLAAKNAISSPGFYEALTEEIGKIGWNVSDASRTHYAHQSEDGTPASVLQGIAAQAMPASAIGPLVTLMDRIEAGTTDAATASFLTTWWNSVQAVGSSTLFSASPLTLDETGQATATLAYLDFAMTASDWQSFFLSHVASDTEITLVSRTMTLNLPLWEHVKPTIVQRLGQAALDSIATLDL